MLTCHTVTLFYEFQSITQQLKVGNRVYFSPIPKSHKAYRSTQIVVLWCVDDIKWLKKMEILIDIATK